MKSALLIRSNNRCEICESTSQNLESYNITPKPGTDPSECVLLCETCMQGATDPNGIDSNHWRCMSGSIWSETAAVKVFCASVLKKIKTDWSGDLLDQIWLEEEEQQWLEAMDQTEEVHKDCHGQILEQGDSVVLVKDLDVKGGGFTAKRGTAVRNIRLVMDNPSQLEGKVEGQQIVILTQYVKKQ
jgi:protein PhnA